MEYYSCVCLFIDFLCAYVQRLWATLDHFWRQFKSLEASCEIYDTTQTRLEYLKQVQGFVQVSSECCPSVRELLGVLIHPRNQNSKKYIHEALVL